MGRWGEQMTDAERISELERRVEILESAIFDLAAADMKVLVIVAKSRTGSQAEVDARLQELVDIHKRIGRNPDGSPVT